MYNTINSSLTTREAKGSQYKDVKVQLASNLPSNVMEQIVFNQFNRGIDITCWYSVAKVQGGSKV